MIYILYTLSIFLSASLLFVIQPLVAKVLLPQFGGTASVWTVCMLFFQLLLLIAYGYAYFISKCKSAYSWRAIHLCLCILSLLALPLALAPKSSLNYPILSILQNLLTISLPLLVVASSAPLLQLAFSRTSAKRSKDPYFLYAASNTGSLLALIAYPTVIERLLPVRDQFLAWSVLYITYVVLLVGAFSLVKKIKITPTVSFGEKPNFKTICTWVGFGFIPCSLMLGVTSYISTDIAATPLLWVIPLALYLLSFIISFSEKPIISHEWLTRNLLIFMVFPVFTLTLQAHVVYAFQGIFIHFTSLFIIALYFHGELYKRRPKPESLTLFYFALSLGGVLAGIFNGLLAPHIFTTNSEYPLILALSFLGISFYNRFEEIISYTLALLLITHILSLTPWSSKSESLTAKRNFFGVKKVFSYNKVHTLMNQTTMHGYQYLGESSLSQNTNAYYGAVLPVIKEAQKKKPKLASALVGLGVGTMACQFRKNDVLDVIEIDKQVIDIARNDKFFTYLKDCPPKLNIIATDGRIGLSKFKDKSLDIITIDAFNSDSIPTHMLTLQAFSLYKQKLKRDGVILVNISNRHLNLLPVVTAAGRELDLAVLDKITGQNPKATQVPSHWVMLTENDNFAIKLMSLDNWRFITNNNNFLWTDDYSNIIPILKWL